MKTPAEIGQDFKQKYPGAYDQYPDEVVGQRALLKDPSLGDSSLGDVAGSAVSNALFRPGSTTRNLMTDPITQAQALPAIAGTAGAVTGLPMGATLGTGGGNLLADAALKSYGRPDLIPSTRSQVLGTAGAALGDVTAIPAINKRIAGSQIGQAESAAGVPAAKDIPSTPMTLGQKSIGDFVNDAYDSLGSNTPKDYTFWKQLKDQTERIYKLGKDAAITGLDKIRLQNLSSMAENGMNGLVPGRAAPAAFLAKSQTVPNAISGAYQAIPGWAKAVGSLVGGDALLNALRSAGKK